MDSQEQPCDVVALPGISVNLVAVPSVGSCVPFTVCLHTNKSNHSWRRCALSLFLLSLLCLGLEVSGWWPTWPGGDGKGAAAPPSWFLGVLPAVTQVTGGAPLRLLNTQPQQQKDLGFVTSAINTGVATSLWLVALTLLSHVQTSP